LGALAGLLLDDGSQGPVYMAGDDGQWHLIPGVVDSATASAAGVDWYAITWYGQLPGTIGDAQTSASPPPTTATPVDTQPTPAAQPAPPTSFNGALAGLLLPDGTQGPVYNAGDDGQWHLIPGVVDAATASAAGVDWYAITWYGQLPGTIGDELPSLQPPGVNPTQPTSSDTTTATLTQPPSNVNPAQPTNGESTPGDWNPGDTNTNPVQPSTDGTPIPSPDEPPSTSTPPSGLDDSTAAILSASFGDITSVSYGTFQPLQNAFQNIGQVVAVALAPAIQTPQQFAELLLLYMGLPLNEPNIKALLQWESSEGAAFASAAKGQPAPTPQTAGYHNPLNTQFTYQGTGPKTPGAYVPPGTQAASYPTWAMGIQATAFTLEEPQYSKILNVLKSSAGGAALQVAVGETPSYGTNPALWSTAPLPPYTYSPTS
jgi:hypothetical protein